MPGAVILVEQILKPIVDRRCYHVDSTPYYPSGTAAGVAAWTTLTWLLAVPVLTRPDCGSRSRIALGRPHRADRDRRWSRWTSTSRSTRSAASATGMGVVLACAAIVEPSVQSCGTGIADAATVEQ